MDKKDFIRLIKRYATVKKWPNGEERAEINIEGFATQLESVFKKRNQSVITDEQLIEIAKEQVLYNDQKRDWWIQGAKHIRDLKTKCSIKSSLK